MSEAVEAEKPAHVAAADVNGQLIASLAIIAVIGLTAISLVVAGCITGKWEVLGVPIGTAIGALATALNAPSGIGNVLRANAAANQAQQP